MVKIFSGIRPSGRLHLGNYLGAIKNWIELQNKSDVKQTIFAVVDLHGITTPYDSKKFPDQVIATACDYLAAGVDPAKSFLIRQSYIPQHTELMWLFSTITPVSWLDRLPNYREKLEEVKQYSGPKITIREEVKVKERIRTEDGILKIKEKIKFKENPAKYYQNNLGLLAYPVLMAADILLYKSNLVPVGEDQLLHLDLANEIGKKFNHLFGDTFEPIKPFITEGARIMSLQHPDQKMSKTGDEGIALSDSSDTIREKIKKAATDSGKEIKFDEKEKAGISNLLMIYSLLSDKKISDLESQYSGKSYVEFKNDLAEVVVNFLKPHQEKYNDLRANPNKVLEILESSEKKARQIAEQNLKEIKSKMGL